MNWYDRRIYNKINNLIKKPSSESQVLLVEGPRQTGKTTLLKHVLDQSQKDVVSLNLELDLTRLAEMDACADFKEFTLWLKERFSFVPGSGQILFIDEAQQSQKLGQFVRFMKEEWPSTTSILTGSMMARLFNEKTRYPVGRVTRILVGPLTFFETLKALGEEKYLKEDLRKISSWAHHDLLVLLNRYLRYGGMPKAVGYLAEKNNPTDYLRETFEHYRQDFLRVFGLSSGNLFEQAMRGVADHVGSPSHFSQALPSHHSHYKKVPDVYSRLELWHIFLTIAQRGMQPEGATLYHPKRYLFDMGFLSLLRSSGVPQVDLLRTIQPLQRQVIGGVLENFLAIHLQSLNWDISGFKKSSAGTEVDFIAKKENVVVPIECKANLKFKESYLTGLKEYMKTYGLKLGIVFTGDQYLEKQYDFGTIINLPFYAVERIDEII